MLRSGARWRFTVGMIVILFTSVMASSAEVLTLGGTGSALGPVTRVAEAYMKTHPEVRVQVLPSLGSGGGIHALADGKIGLALSARPLKESERSSGLSSTEFARTPFVFAVQPERPVAGMALHELVRIYRGERRSWDDGVPLRLIVRPETDADTQILKSMSQPMAVAVEASLRRPGMILATTDQESADLMEGSPGALGTTTLSQIISEKRRLRALAVDGVTPSTDTLADGSYPYYKSFYLVTRGGASAPAVSFAAFLRSDEGREVLARNGCWVPR